MLRDYAMNDICLAFSYVKVHDREFPVPTMVIEYFEYAIGDEMNAVKGVFSAFR